MVAKGEGWGKVGGERGRRGLRGIMISTHSVRGSRGRLYSTEWTGRDSVASYYADGH